MKTKLMLALLLSAATVPAFAQNTLDNTSNSGSASTANSGSVSGAQSNPTVTTQNDATNVNAQGNISTNSASDSSANSGSVSHSGSVSDQTQGQSLSNSNTNQLGASNQQGVTVNQQWNSTPLRRTYVGTNAAVPLAASSSFSSDYCGGTASGGASAAPIGISIGGAAPTFDKSCQSLRRAEKFGMAAANWNNMGYPDRAVAMMRLMEWSICTSDSKGPKPDTSIAEACDKVLSMSGSPASAPPPPATYAPEPAVSDSNGKVTPEATIKAGERGASFTPKEISRIDIAASQPPKP